MNLNIELDKKYYKSDSITNGRTIASFFEELSKNIFKQSYRYWDENYKITKRGELPILFSERNIYSTIAVAINKITPIHMSEWSFNQSEHDKIDKSRRVDFWCLNREGSSGNPINYFLEIKKGWYSLNKSSNEDFQVVIKKDIQSLITQTKELKEISPEWDDADDVFIGISIIHGYSNPGQEHYNYINVRENIHKQLNNDTNLQLITSTWHIPKTMNVQWEKSKCEFVTIAGIVVSKNLK